MYFLDKKQLLRESKTSISVCRLYPLNTRKAEGLHQYKRL
jgi:hypothetical protein